MQHQNDDSFPIPPATHRSQTPPNQPSREAAQQPLSTPRKSGTPRSATNVTEHRSIILDQMKDEMVHCDKWEDSFNLYLPDVRIVKEDIKAAVTALKDKRLLEDIDDPDQKYQFTAFQTNPASIGTPSEMACYKPLVDICQALGGLQLVHEREASCELVQKPYSYNTAETPGANFKVDAYLKLLHSTMPASRGQPTKIPIADMAVPSEYKKNGGDFVANRGQLLGTTTFCMNDDPRRMHIYGITIEDSKMNVWYFSRSHSAKSPEFDFTKDPERYIRVMLSFLFATKEQLGYDPTVEHRLEDKELCFVYKVVENPEDQAEKRDRYFKTQGAIFEHRSLCTTGRATRVWKVVEVRSFNELQPLGGPTMVLKDVWLDSDSKTEGQNLDAIFERLKEIAGLLNKGDKGLESLMASLGEKSKNALMQCLKEGTWSRYFLSKVCDWQGRESKKAPPAAQPDPTLFDSPTSTITPSSHPHSDRTRTTPYQATNPVPVVQTRLPRRYCPKRQYRVIFKEVCEALHHVRQLQDVATALLDSVFALELMFLAGWVHRDISSGNIYAYRFQESGTDKVRGILADLEYAKRFEPEHAEGSSDPKTGTAFFMAVEIQSQVLFYNPAASQSMASLAKGRNKELDNNEEEESEEEESEESSPEEEASESNLNSSIDVIHNFEHDMESIFWLFLWILLARFPPERTEEEKRAFEGAVSTIFQDTSLCPLQRERVFTRDGALAGLLKKWLNPELRTLVKRLVKLQKALLDGYYRREFNFNDLASYARLYRYVLKVLKSCRKVAKKLGMQGPTSGSPVHLPAQVKRAHSKVDVDGGDVNESSSKVVRVDGSTDAASSRTLHQQNPEVSEHEESGQSAKSV